MVYNEKILPMQPQPYFPGKDSANPCSTIPF